MRPARISNGYRWAALAAPWPALVLGAFLMCHERVAVWNQNLLVGALLTLVCVGVLWLAPPPLKPIWRGVAAGLAVGLLLLTFADARSAGVHRWVQAGPLRLHAGAVVLPVIIIVLCRELVAPGGNRAGWLALPLAFGVLALLTRQPDAAQAMAFAGALLVALVAGRRSSWQKWLVASFIIACAAFAWTRPDPLLPVRHVEGIVGLAAGRGFPWLAAAWVSLGLLPWPFLLARREDDRARSGMTVALGVYFLLTLLAPLLGAFPVPLLGYGLSPLVGYFSALTWLLASPVRSDA